MLHFLNLSEFSIIKTHIADLWQPGTCFSVAARRLKLTTFVLKRIRVLRKIEKMWKMERILTVQHQIILKLFPNVLISGYKLQKWQNFELPAVSWIFAFAIDDPSPCNNSSRLHLHFSFLNKVHSFKSWIFIEYFSVANFIDRVTLIDVNVEQRAPHKLY